MADPIEEVIVVPQKGSYQWPGRETLDDRTRILLEARTMEELLELSGTIEANNLESVLGFWEYLQADWRWLHDPAFQKRNPDYFSWHNASLREGGHYLRETKWRGEIPETDGISDYFDTLCN
ncbi:MAG: hypothetical protein SF051_01550 [Elusimicrobiota bacterium]|nr:hypothetical protein [Elusimicrobiota bacterium]